MNPFDDWMPVSDRLFPFTKDWVMGSICYIVYWPEHGVVKAGSTAYPARYRKFVHRGAQLVYVRKGTPELHGLHDELAWDKFIREIGGAPLPSRESSLPLLGDGCGWMECHKMNAEQLELLASEIQRRAHAMVQSR